MQEIVDSPLGEAVYEQTYVMTSKIVDPITRACIIMYLYTIINLALANTRVETLMTPR